MLQSGDVSAVASAAKDPFARREARPKSTWYTGSGFQQAAADKVKDETDKANKPQTPRATSNNGGSKGLTGLSSSSASALLQVKKSIPKEEETNLLGIESLSLSCTVPPIDSVCF